MSHVPVLLEEVLEALQPTDGETYVDGTFGGGGYALRVLEAADCQLIGIDRDLDAITRAEALADQQPRLTPLLGRFGDLDELLEAAGVSEVHGVMLDIGVSSFQIDEGDRGLFLHAGWTTRYAHGPNWTGRCGRRESYERGGSDDDPSPAGRRAAGQKNSRRHCCAAQY